MTKLLYNKYMILIFLFLLNLGNSFSNHNSSHIKTTINRGHSSEINKIIFSPNDEYVITQDRQETIIVWDYKSAKRLFSTKLGKIHDCLFKDDKIYVLNVKNQFFKKLNSLQNLEKSTVYLHELPSNKTIKSWSFEGKIASVKFSKQTIIGHLIPHELTTGKKKQSEIIDVVRNKRICLLNHSDFSHIEGGLENIVHSYFSSDGNMFVFEVNKTGKSHIELWSLKTYEIIKLLDGHKGQFSCGAFSPNNEYFAINAGKNTIIWNTKNNHKPIIFEDSPSRDAITFNTSSTLIASSGGYLKGADVYIFDIKTRKKVFVIKDNQEISNVLQFSKMDNSLAIGFSNKIELWSIPNTKKIRTFSSATDEIVFANIYNNNGTPFLLTSSKDKTTKVWSLNNRFVDTYIHPYPINAFAFSSRYNLFAVSYASIKGIAFFKDIKGYIDVFNLDSFNKMKSISKGRVIRSINFSPNKSEIVFGCSGHIGSLSSEEMPTIYKYNFKNNYFNEFNSEDIDISDIQFNSDGQYLFSFQEGGWSTDLHHIMLWKYPNGKLIETLDNNQKVTSFDLNDKENMLAVSTSDDKHKDKYINFWNLNNNSFIRKISFTENITKIKYNTDFSILAVGFANGDIKILNSSNNNEIITLQAHIDEICLLSFSEDGKHLFSASKDLSLKLWNLKKFKEIATIFSIGTDWAVVSPEGYFDCSEGAKQSICFTYKLNAYELDQFFEDYYKPGLLSFIFNNEPLLESSQNITDKLTLSPPPNVKIISPQNSETIYNKIIPISINIKDNGGGIDEIKLLHNGKRVSTTKRGGAKITPKNNGLYNKDYQISLINGENTITASAFSKGRIESKQHSITVYYRGIDNKTDLYILSVGINEYRNGSLNLNFAQPDAISFLNTMKSKSFKLFNNIYPSSLYDFNATKYNILNAFETIASNAKENDVFIFYFAGHGAIADNLYFFSTHNTVQLHDYDSQKINGISIEDIYNSLVKIQARKQLVFLDACESTETLKMLAYANPITNTRGNKIEKAIAQLQRSAGIHIFASSGKDAWELEEFGHGVFTYTLLKGLSGSADCCPLDKQITISELKNYVNKEVPLITKKFCGESQFPQTPGRVGSMDFPIVILQDNMFINQK